MQSKTVLVNSIRKNTHAQEDPPATVMTQKMADLQQIQGGQQIIYEENLLASLNLRENKKCHVPFPISCPSP
jgi:hypothetical protein